MASAPTVSKVRIDALVASLSFETARVPNTSTTVATARLPNGFVLPVGECHTVHPANYDAEEGKRRAIADATDKARKALYEHEGYILANLLHAQANQVRPDAALSSAWIDQGLAYRRSQIDAQIRNLQSAPAQASQVHPDSAMPSSLKQQMEVIRTHQNEISRIAGEVLEASGGQPVEINIDRAQVAALGQQQEKQALPPHHQLVIDEKTNLDVRIVETEAFISGPLFVHLSAREQGNLCRQIEAMKFLSSIMQERIDSFQ